MSNEMAESKGNDTNECFYAHTQDGFLELCPQTQALQYNWIDSELNVPRSMDFFTFLEDYFVVAPEMLGKITAHAAALGETTVFFLGFHDGSVLSATVWEKDDTGKPINVKFNDVLNAKDSPKTPVINIEVFVDSTPCEIKIHHRESLTTPMTLPWSILPKMDIITLEDRIFFETDMVTVTGGLPEVTDFLQYHIGKKNPKDQDFLLLRTSLGEKRDPSCPLKNQGFETDLFVDVSMDSLQEILQNMLHFQEVRPDLARPVVLWVHACDEKLNNLDEKDEHGNRKYRPYFDAWFDFKSKYPSTLSTLLIVSGHQVTNYPPSLLMAPSSQHFYLHKREVLSNDLPESWLQAVSRFQNLEKINQDDLAHHMDLALLEARKYLSGFCIGSREASLNAMRLSKRFQTWKTQKTIYGESQSLVQSIKERSQTFWDRRSTLFD